MIDVTAAYTVGGLVCLATTAVLLWWLGRLPARYHRYCYPAVFVVALTGVAALLDAAGLGVLVVNGTELAVPSLVSDLVAYPVLWVTAVALAGVDRRTLVLFAAVPFLQRAAFAVATVSGGLLGLGAALFVMVGHAYLGYLILGRVWREAEQVPAEQRVLHWKVRNHLLFLIGMIIVFAVLALGALFDGFVSAVLTQYMNVLIRVGFAGFLFANARAIDPASMPDDLFPAFGRGEESSAAASAD